EVLERELPGDGLGEVAFKVDAAAWVVEPAAGHGPRRRPGIEHPVEPRHPGDAEGPLLVRGLQVEAGVIEVVVGVERNLAEVQVAVLLGPADGRRIAAGGLRQAPPPPVETAARSGPPPVVRAGRLRKPSPGPSGSPPMPGGATAWKGDG